MCSTSRARKAHERARVENGHRLHVGAAHEATYRDHELALAALVQDPFAELGSREAGVTVEMGDLSRRMGPTELRELAAVLVD
ncbi:DUF6907 domain-containing protein [Streptomyces rubiginosohelvolus]